MSRCAAPFVMVSSLVLNVGAGEFSEGNAVAWGAFASDNAAVSVSDDARRVRVGAQSVRLVTASGFDTGVRYPAAPTAHWDASTNTHLAFWTFADNTNSAGFQGNQPVVVLKTAGGSYRYEPAGSAGGDYVDLLPCAAGGRRALDAHGHGRTHARGRQPDRDSPGHLGLWLHHLL